MTIKSIVFPTQSGIDEWNNIEKPPIVEDVEISSPASTFIHYTNMSYFHHALFAKTHLTASREINTIQLFDDCIKAADHFIYDLYARRSITKALLPSVDRSEVIPDNETPQQAEERQARQAAVRKATEPLFTELYILLNDCKTFASDTVSHLIRLFSDNGVWSNGQYSANLIHAICRLFYRLATLDEMHLIKPSLANDFSNLMSYAFSGKGNQNQNEYIQLKQWISAENSIENELLDGTKEIPEALRSKVFHIVMPVLIDFIEKKKYVVPEDLYAYLRTSLFMIRFFTPDQKSDSNVKDFLLNQAMAHPVIPLTIEIASTFTDLVRKSNAFPNLKPTKANYNYDQLQSELHNFLITFPAHITLANQGDLDVSQIYDEILHCIQLIGRTKNAVRELLIQKLLYPPDNPTIKSPFERSVRIGFSNADLKTVLHIISLWRSAHDLLRDHFATITRLVTLHINRTVQNFIKNELEKILIRCKKMKDQVEAIISPLRELTGDWMRDEERTGHSNIKNFKDHTILDKLAPTPPATIEFIRIQISHMINEGNELLRPVKPKDRGLGSDDIAAINNFLNASENFESILLFDEVLIDVGDQSDLYFREVQLDINNVTAFPIRASLPFVLCEYALSARKSYGTEKDQHGKVVPENAELIFYPLAIYDDAANRARTKLASKMLMDEIMGEATICLSTLTTLISDFTFNAFRSYATMKYIPDNIQEGLKKTVDPDQWPQNRSYRLITMIQQNSYYLHGQNLDLRSLITKVVDGYMCDSVESTVGLFDKYGIASGIAVTKTLDILNDTRRLLCEAGLTLMPFELMVKSALGISVPSSFHTRLMEGLKEDICHNIAYKCYMRSNPTRFFPDNPGVPGSASFGKGNLGKILRDALLPTFSVITNEHFSVIIRLLDSGTIAQLLKDIQADFSKKIERFVELYNKQAPKLQRFKDEPMNTPSTLVFDRFEGAYRFFAEDTEIEKLFKAMKALGNIMSIASMLDISIAVKKLTKMHIAGFLRGSSIDGKEYNDEIFNFLPEGSVASDAIKRLDERVTGKDVHPPFISALVRQIYDTSEKTGIFDERAINYLMFETLTGFARAWSVLEFVFCINCVDNKMGSSLSPLQVYGEGVMFIAGAIIAIIEQENIHFATDIGRRIMRVKGLDFASANNDRLARFCSLYELESSSLHWAISVISPIAKQMKLADQYEDK